MYSGLMGSHSGFLFLFCTAISENASMLTSRIKVIMDDAEGLLKNVLINLVE